MCLPPFRSCNLSFEVQGFAVQCPERLKGLVLAALGEKPSNRLKAVKQWQSPRQPDGMPQSKGQGQLFRRLHHMPTGQAMNSQTSTPNSARLTASRVRSFIAAPNLIGPRNRLHSIAIVQPLEQSPLVCWYLSLVYVDISDHLVWIFVDFLCSSNGSFFCGEPFSKSFLSV